MYKINEKNKKIIKICIVITIFVLIIAVITCLIIKYNTEGDKNLPFEIKNIRVVSTAQGDSISEDMWNLNIIQKNDFYFYIEKNSNYSKEDSIGKISFDNFKFERSSDLGNIQIYKPTSNTILYKYTDEYKLDNNITYTGALTTNIPSLEIGNQGGLIGFSIILNDLGNYLTDHDSEIIHDGTLLSKLNLSQEDISIKCSFDIIIETISKKKFRATVNFDLPTGNIIENGKEILDKNNFDDIAFKRY